MAKRGIRAIDKDAKALGNALFTVFPTPESRFKNAKLAGVADKDSVTRELRTGILDAAAAHGADGMGAGGLTGYLFLLASEHPKTFGSLLVKMLPLQVDGGRSGNNTIGTINVVSVPVDQYLNADDIRKLNPATIVDAATQQMLDTHRAANDDSDNSDSAGL